MLQLKNSLKKLNSNTPRDDGKLILGDINAKVGNGSHNMWYFGTGSNLNIASINFEMQENSYDYIDHVLIDLRHGSDILDVRTYRGADVDSDNYLVVSDRKLSVDKLSNNQETREGYQVQLEDISCEPKIRLEPWFDEEFKEDLEKRRIALNLPHRKLESKTHLNAKKRKSEKKNSSLETFKSWETVYGTKSQKNVEAVEPTFTEVGDIVLKLNNHKVLEAPRDGDMWTISTDLKGLSISHTRSKTGITIVLIYHEKSTAQFVMAPLNVNKERRSRLLGPLKSLRSQLESGSVSYTIMTIDLVALTKVLQEMLVRIKRNTDVYSYVGSYKKKYGCIFSVNINQSRCSMLVRIKRNTDVYSYVGSYKKKYGCIFSVNINQSRCSMLVRIKRNTDVYSV
ncbi:hypothetical protein CWI38_1488p0010, partial [Hamiltosporidium tvaerminnensis]